MGSSEVAALRVQQFALWRVRSTASVLFIAVAGLSTSDYSAAANRLHKAAMGLPNDFATHSLSCCSYLRASCMAAQIACGRSELGVESVSRF